MNEQMDNSDDRRKTPRREHSRLSSGERRTTKKGRLNTMNDVIFAENYLEHVSRNSSRVRSAKAKIALGIIAMLDATSPDWREVLLDDLADKDIQRKVESLFLIDEANLGTTDSLYDSLINEIVGAGKPMKS